MMKTLGRILSLATALAPGVVLAGDFDGSRPLLCASQAAMDMMPGEEVVAGLPRDIGAPTFMRVDFGKKTITGPERATPIRSMEKDEKQLLLQGNELGLAWTLALDQEQGRMTATLVDRDGAVVVFGACTPL